MMDLAQDITPLELYMPVGGHVQNSPRRAAAGCACTPLCLSLASEG